MYSFKTLDCKVKEKGKMDQNEKGINCLFVALVKEKFEYVEDSC